MQRLGRYVLRLPHGARAVDVAVPGGVRDDREDALRERRDHAFHGDEIRIIGHGSQGTVPRVEPLLALERIAYLLELRGDPRYKVEAFRKAADVVATTDAAELADRARPGG